MRALLSFLILLALTVPLRAQGGEPIQAPPSSGEEPEDEGAGGDDAPAKPGDPGDEDGGTPAGEAAAGGQPGAGDPGGEEPAGEEAGDDAVPEDGAEPEDLPEEPPAWQMPDSDARRFERLLENYFHPGRQTRQDHLEKFQRLLERDIDGHSALEDVLGISKMANRAREFGRFVRGGKVYEVEVGPDTHGFPGGIGTVRYRLYVPEDYRDRELWPLVFCLPDNKTHADPEQYIEKVWVERSKAIAERFLVAVPEPEAKGDSWLKEKSYARAMIALRHCMGTFNERGRKEGGPATDMFRTFIAGGEEAALVAARYPEIFAGAVLQDVDGRVSGQPDIHKIGRLSGLPACIAWDGSSRRQEDFAQKVEKANGATKVVEVGAGSQPFGDLEAVAEWLQQLPERDGQPRSIEYAVHDSTFQRHYWINVLEFDASVQPAPSFAARANRATNEVRVNVDGVTRFELFLNDALVDLNRPVRIVVSDGEDEYEFFNDKAPRELGRMLDELVASNHPWRVYPVRFLVDVGQLRKREVAKAAQ